MNSVSDSRQAAAMVVGVPGAKPARAGAADDSAAAAETPPVQVSAVVPVYNEVENVADLLAEIHASLTGFGRSFEIIIVDDGSSDGTQAAVQDCAGRYPELRPVFLARNYGQSTAMQAGFDHARGEVVVTLDGDLQNDPADIPLLVETLEREDVDLVSGWRRDRHDDFLRVRLSRIANRLISRMTHVSLHDYGCTLKAYRRDILDQITVSGELHRFIPALMAQVGAEVREVVVNHRPRTRGQSKYSLDRTLRVALDLILMVFLRKYIQRPLHFFGGLGAVLGTVGLAICLYLVVVKLGYGEDIGNRPLLTLGVSLSVSALILIVQGLLGELIVRLLHQSDSQPQYRLRLDRKNVRAADPGDA